MCDHNWILLTTYEYERLVFNSKTDVWSVRGCILCGEVEKENAYGRRGWTKARIGAFPLSTLGKEYYRRLRLFAGGRDV